MIDGIESPSSTPPQSCSLIGYHAQLLSFPGCQYQPTDCPGIIKKRSIMYSYPDRNSNWHQCTTGPVYLTHTTWREKEMEPKNAIRNPYKR
mmetsp:Transcript_10056/g.16197  ORF Transcript_10056/g.16197 Transcript_10056/m.16197 type:complete len:91 (-) Transcript_10056:438-710(-)